MFTECITGYVFPLPYKLPSAIIITFQGNKFNFFFFPVEVETADFRGKNSQVMPIVNAPHCCSKRPLSVVTWPFFMDFRIRESSFNMTRGVGGDEDIEGGSENF